MNNAPFYTEHTGELNQSNYLRFTTLGLTVISIIIQAFDIDNNKIRFSNQKYTISASNNENNDQDYIELFNVNLGFDYMTSNSLTEGFKAAIFYRHLQITVPQITDVKTKIIVSAR